VERSPRSREGKGEQGGEEATGRWRDCGHGTRCRGRSRRSGRREFNLRARKGKKSSLLAANENERGRMGPGNAHTASIMQERSWKALPQKKGNRRKKSRKGHFPRLSKTSQSVNGQGGILSFCLPKHVVRTYPRDLRQQPSTARDQGGLHPVATTQPAVCCSRGCQGKPVLHSSIINRGGRNDQKENTPTAVADHRPQRGSAR